MRIEDKIFLVKDNLKNRKVYYNFNEVKKYNGDSSYSVGSIDFDGCMNREVYIKDGTELHHAAVNMVARTHIYDQLLHCDNATLTINGDTGHGENFDILSIDPTIVLRKI